MAYNGARVQLPMGQLGFTNIQNMSKSPIEGAIQAEGLEFIEGSVQREMGNIVHPAAFSGDSLFIDSTEYYPSPNVKRLVFFTLNSGGQAVLWKNDGTATVTGIKYSLTWDGTMGSQFVQGGGEAALRPKKLFFFNGYNPVQVLSGDGTGTTDISKPPADWNGVNQPFFGIMHNNCLWAGGNRNDPFRIYKSAPGDHEDFTTDSYSISIFPGEGSTLCGGYSMNGRLFLFKRPTGIYWVDDTSTNKNDWGVRKLVDTVGLMNPNALCMSEEDLIFLDPTPALYSLSAVQEFGDVKPRSLLEEFGVDRWLIDNMSKQTIDWDLNYIPKVVWHNGKRSIILTFRKLPGIYGRMVLDYRFSPMKVSYSFRDPHQISMMITNDAGNAQHVYGHGPVLYRGDQESRVAATVSAGPWPSKYQIPHTNLAFAESSIVGNRINLEWLTIESTMGTEQVISVDVYLDGAFKYTINFDFPSTLAGFVLDSAHLDQNQLGGFATHMRSKRLRGTCERFSFVFYSNHPTANFVINDVIVSFRQGTARLRRTP